MTTHGWNTTYASNDEDEPVVAGWEHAMTEVVENEYSEHVERRISYVGGDGLADIAALSRSGSVGSAAAGPPLIIQSTTVDSTPLVQLESTESEKSEEVPNDETAGSWLDLADSSSSKGSQGSYADQVPALSGSGSAQDPFDVMDFQSQRADRTTQPPPLDTISTDVNQIAAFSPAARSLREMPTDEVKSPTKHTVDAVLHCTLADEPAPPVCAMDSMEDILGPIDIKTRLSHSEENMEDEAPNIGTKESVDDILGPRTNHNISISTKESIEDILGPKSEVTGYARVETLSDTNDKAMVPSPPKTLITTNMDPCESPFNGLPDTSEVSPQAESRKPSSDKDDTLDSLVNSLEGKQSLQTHPVRMFIGPKTSNVSQSSTFESQGSYATSQSGDGFTTELSKQESSWTDSRHPLSPGSITRFVSTSVDTSYSRDGTLSVDASSYSRDSAASRGMDAFSPSSQNDSIFSSDVSHTASDGETNTLSCEGSMNCDPSIFSGETGYTSYTAYTDRSAYTRGTETEVSFTEHTRSTGISSKPSSSARGSIGTTFFTAHTRTSLTQSIQERSTENPSSRHSSAVGGTVAAASSPSVLRTTPRGDQDVRSNKQASAIGPTHVSPSGNAALKSSPRDDTLVQPQVQVQTHPNGGSSPPPATPQSEKQRSHLAQSLIARTRSRADTSAVLSATSPTLAAATVTSRPTMVRIGEELDEQFIVNTALARKRVSVVQLLVVGLLSLLVCLFGAFWIQSSCHYVSADVRVGDTNEVFNLHYGLWKFSPMGSAFQGYTYCDKYDKEYTIPPPTFPRLASLLASLGGAYAVCVLWVYLIFGRGTRLHWNAAVRVAFLAGLLHGASLLIFISPICYEKDCELGPAGILSLVAVAANFMLSFEMYYNSPIKSWMDDVPSCPSNEEPRRMMQTLEMADFQEGASAYCRRLIGSPSAEIPTLNQFQRIHDDSVGESLVGRGHSKGVYTPPAIV